MGAERRQHERLIPRKDMVAIFAPTPTMAKVKDISRTGLGLEYLEGSTEGRHWEEVNLFLSDSKDYLSALPFQLVYDRQAQQEPLEQAHLHKRVCGVLFGPVSEYQAAQLDLILNQHTSPA